MVTANRLRNGGLVILTMFTFVLINLFNAAPAFAQDDDGGDDCGSLDIGCKAGEAIKTTVSGVLGKLIDMILALAAQLFGYLMDFFRRDPVSNPDAINESMEWVTNMTADIVVYAIAFGLIIGVGKVAVSRSDQQGHASGEAAKSAMKAAFAATAATPVLMSLIAATDAISDMIFESAGDIDQAKQTITEMLVTEESELTTERLLLLIIAIMAIFAFLDLLLQLFIRQFVFIASTVFLPIAGANSSSEQGQAVWSSMIRLLTGLLLFKPICALIFSIGIRYANNNDANENDFVTILLFIAPVLAMPLLLQLVGGAGGAVGGGMMAAGGTVGVAKAAGGIMKKAGGAAGKAGGAAKSAMGGGGGKGTSGGTTGTGGPNGGGPNGGGGASPGGPSGGGAGGPGGRGGSGGGSGGTPPRPTPPPAMTHKSPSSQPRSTPSSSRTAGGAKGSPKQAAAPKQGQGAKGEKGGKSGNAVQSKDTAAKSPQEVAAAHAQTDAAGGGHHEAPEPNVQEHSAPPSRGSETTQHKERLSNSFPEIYNRQPLAGGKR